MKKIQLFSVLILTLLFVAACGNEKKEKETTQIKPNIEDTQVVLDSTVSNPLETKVIRLLITNHFSTYYINKGEEKGLEFEIINLYAKDRGFKVVLEKIESLHGLNDSIISKKMHIAASTMLIPEDPNSRFVMSDYLYKTNEVLVKRKGLRNYDPTSKPINIHVLMDGPFAESYHKNHKKVPGINFVKAEEHDSWQGLITEVALGKIDYTIANEMEAQMMQVFYPDLDISQPLLKNAKVAFAMHPKLKDFQEDFNAWLNKNRAKSDFQWTIHKYHSAAKHVTTSMVKVLPNKVITGKISNYDHFIKDYAKKIEWDWHLIAALIHQESRFNTNCKSYAGALGLMQLMPRTGKAHGAKSIDGLFIPEVNIKAGTSFLNWIEKNFFNENEITQSERQKFILASYNAGPSHIEDARRLAKKYNLNPNVWKDNVEKMILAKSSPKYFNDPVCKYGYCHGIQVTTYVNNILNYYDHYLSYKND